MGIMVQAKFSGPVFVLECVCCTRDLRIKADKPIEEVLKHWPGVHGNFNGKRELICEFCLVEAKTGQHAPFTGETRKLNATK